MEDVYVGNKIIGQIEGLTFYKRVRSSKHMLRKPLAWAIDAVVFETIERRGIERIVISDKDTGIEYYSTVENWRQHQIKIDRGYGVQYALVLSKFS